MSFYEKENIFKELFWLLFNLNFVLFECFNGLGYGILFFISGKGVGMEGYNTPPLFIALSIVIAFSTIATAKVLALSYSWR